MVGHTLILLRHAKSDWSGAHADRDRPIGERGRRQAAEAGRWLATYAGPLGRVVVSPARRAATTWELAGAELVRTEPPGAPEVVTDERMYSFGAEPLLEVVRGLPESIGSAALVGHNPAMEELVENLTGEWLAMPTASLAVLALPGRWVEAGGGGASLNASGRPPRAPGDPG